MKNKDLLYRISVLVFMDIIMLFLSYVFAYSMYYSFRMPYHFIQIYASYFIGAIVIKLAILYFTQMYGTLWRYASLQEMFQIIVGVFLSNLATVIFAWVFSVPIPLVICILVFVFDVVLIGSVRAVYRIARALKNNHVQLESNVLIVGAGEAGIRMLRETNNIKFRKKIVGFIDDDPRKKKKMINGVRILGGRENILDIVAEKSVDEIIIAMPTIGKEDKNEIINICHQTGCKVMILPNIDEILNYDPSAIQLRNLQIEDLLDRDEVHLEKGAIQTILAGKDIMVTGGAGSIGSELCRQILKYNPKTLTIMDINENTLYYLEIELRKYIQSKQLDTVLNPVIGSIRDEKGMEEFVAKYKPQIVYHAAAHKHVPHMERTPREAVKNNIFGTLNLIRGCHKHKVERFVQISTDKAVNPTNVMGATKRVCEILMQCYNQVSDTRFVAVRFGNVLGSNGSVIPIFKEQIESGGPVTVTDKNIIRFFMTIPEASQLVLQASSLAQGGEIFVLDMGEPVKILDLAEKMIRLTGNEPYVDIDIKFTGLRPGEKMYEELSYDTNEFVRTQYEDIFVEPKHEFDIEEIKQGVDKLKKALDDESDEECRRELMKMIGMEK